MQHVISLSGEGLPPAFPALKGSPIALGSVAEHIDIVYKGKAGTGMQGYGKQLSLKELAAVVTYERNAWGNDTGDLVQAADVDQVASGGSANTQASSDDAASAPAETQVAAPAVEEDLDKVFTMEELMAKGEQVYSQACVACHMANGEGMPPAFPALKGSAIALGDVNAHIDMVANGSKKNPAMQGFANQLSKADMAAVITYERNAWGNNTGDMVQIADIVAASAK